VPYLDWVINETLRLRPSVPGGLARVTPPEGLMVDDVFIPGDIVTSVPTYTMQRDERYWPDALSFKPERWEGLHTEKVPWIPFTRGQWACSGKALAMMEMRMVLGRIALQYDISFPAGVTAENVDFRFKDTFTQTLPPLPLVFTPTSR
jgi:cytochrome P450